MLAPGRIRGLQPASARRRERGPGAHAAGAGHAGHAVPRADRSGSPSTCRAARRACWSGSKRHVNPPRRPSPTSASSSTPRCRSRRRAGSIRSCCRCWSAGSCGCPRSPSAGGCRRDSRFFVRRHARRIGAVVETISEQSTKRLRRDRRPGDVRELQSLIERSGRAREPVRIHAALLDEGRAARPLSAPGEAGRGGMGEVWRARHQLIARPC